MGVLEFGILAVATIALAAFNWEFSIKARRFHGIYRFFSFESIVVLILLNRRLWFFQPFSWNQIVSWILLVSSIPLAVEGFRLLRIVGKPQGQFENTTKLVTVGLYRYIRHPLYGSLILVGLGVFFKQVSPLGVVLALVNLGAMIATAKTEEKEMVRSFGSEYELYMLQTKMFIPYII
ncbi:MAG: isoprenylcysteine carboxylmethyltransferase family protein [Ignavibacteriales bacterium]|nr:isoprenylcysteine carboxylmethyltransferase family protein [Ignavibacteriales bacterium]